MHGSRFVCCFTGDFHVILTTESLSSLLEFVLFGGACAHNSVRITRGGNTHTTIRLYPLYFTNSQF